MQENQDTCSGKDILERDSGLERLCRDDRAFKKNHTDGNGVEVKKKKESRLVVHPFLKLSYIQDDAVDQRLGRGK